MFTVIQYHQLTLTMHIYIYIYRCVCISFPVYRPKLKNLKIIQN